jgi:hypothetical protein
MNVILASTQSRLAETASVPKLLTRVYQVLSKQFKCTKVEPTDEFDKPAWRFNIKGGAKSVDEIAAALKQASAGKVTVFGRGNPPPGDETMIITKNGEEVDVTMSDDRKDLYVYAME